MLTHKAASHQCTCGVAFHRLDVLNKHQLKCVKITKKSNRCDLCSSIFSQKSHLTRHIKKCDIKQRVIKLEEVTKEYDAKLKEGKMLEKILQQNSHIKEEALSPAEKEALKLYQSSCETNMDMDSIQLVFIQHINR